MNKQSEFDKLKKKIDKFLKTNNDLCKIGVCDVIHDGERRYLQMIFSNLADIAEKYGIKASISEWNGGGDFKWEVALNELKVFAIATDRELKDKGLLPENQ